MEGYRIFKYQKEVLEQQTMPDGTRYNPVKDENGEFFIFETEHENCGLGTLAEYISPTTTIEP